MGTPSRVARAVGRAATAARVGARTVLSLDTNPVPATWRHVTKIDPEDDKRLPLLYPLYLQHTSAVSVGGSRDVTHTNTEETFELLGYADVPVFHEPSAADHVTAKTRAASDFLAIPEVLNGDATALVGTLGAGTAYLRDELVPGLLDEEAGWLPAGVRDRVVDFATSWLLERAVFEAYLIQNPESAAAREANVTAADVLSPAEAAQRALAAERHLGSEVIYVEYSGTFGEAAAVELLEAVADSISWSRIWYGGGLDSRERTAAVLAAGADTVVVGNVFHDIATEEAALCSRAAEALGPDADRAAVRDWVDDAVAVEDTSAAAYLATIPAIEAPSERAAEYVAATVETWLGLRDLRTAAAESVTDEATLDQFVAEQATGELPGAVSLRDGRDAADELAKAYARGYLAADLGLESHPMPLSHIGVFAE